MNLQLTNDLKKITVSSMSFTKVSIIRAMSFLMVRLEYARSMLISATEFNPFWPIACWSNPRNPLNDLSAEHDVAEMDASIVASSS